MTEANAAPAGGPADAAAPLRPGALLRQARERAGLGVEDLAGQLKLAKNTLEALERDDFETLKEPVYVRGYYRKIAKVLPIAESELLAAYEAHGSKKPAAAKPMPPRIPLAGGVAAGTSRRVQGPGVGLAVLVVAALGLLLLLVDGKPPPQRLKESPPAHAAAEAPAAVAPAASVPPSAAHAAAGEPAAASGITSASSSAAPAAAGESPTQLVLEFGEPTFVRVEDNRNKTLAIGLARAGEKQVLDGQPPYTVFLGNAQKVSVTFHGQKVDFSHHVNQQNDTARFTVP